MPRISRFYGIVITMYYDDHDPPHFHAQYGDDRAVFTISPTQRLRGRLPERAESLVLDWAAQHTAELAENWDRATRMVPLKPIAPLP